MQIVDLNAGTVFVGGAGPDRETAETLLLRYANRHGLIAGATGTGKTVTLQTLAESFSTAGVPVVAADVKGDLAGIAMPGSAEAGTHEAFAARAATIGCPLDYQAYPVTFWDIFGELGHPIRTTPAEMGPLLLARLLQLTEAQEGVLNIVFRVADEEGLALLDLKDLQMMLVWVGENARDLSLRYGNISAASIGAIQRRLLVLETQGGDHLFGEPALELADLVRNDASGRGMINIIAVEKLMTAPRLYATFLLWLMSELFEQLPEVGDPKKPVLVFFFDEAHLLFQGASPALVEKIQQVARLIRSKGVSVWFCTQNPTDLPDAVLGQLGNRVQHALRAFTAKDQRALRQAAENYRPNPEFAVADAIRDVGVGEAVTSFLEEKGVPGMAQQTLIRPPQSRLGTITPAERAQLVATSGMGLKYDTPLDRESAAEILAARAASAAEEAEAAEKAAPESADDGITPGGRRYSPGAQTRNKKETGLIDALNSTAGKEFTRSFVRSVSRRAGSAVARGVLGNIFRGR